MNVVPGPATRVVLGVPGTPRVLTEANVADKKVGLSITMPKNGAIRAKHIQSMRVHNTTINGEAVSLGVALKPPEAAHRPPPSDATLPKGVVLAPPADIGTLTRESPLWGSLRPSGVEGTAFLDQLQQMVDTSREVHSAHLASAQRIAALEEQAKARDAERGALQKQLGGLSNQLDAEKELRAREHKEKRKEEDKFKQIRTLHKGASDANAKLHEQLAAANKRLQALERELRARGGEGGALLGDASKSEEPADGASSKRPRS